MLNFKIAAYIGTHITKDNPTYYKGRDGLVQEHRDWFFEPGSGSSYVVFTDDRDVGGDFTKSRIRSEFRIATDDLGYIDKFSPDSQPGVSHRREVKVAAYKTIDGKTVPIYSQGLRGTGDETRKTTVTTKSSFANFPGERPTSDNATDFAISASGNYPFVAVSPDIDYSLKLDIRKDRFGEVLIRYTFTHDLFPDYELLLDGKVLVNFQTTDI